MSTSYPVSTPEGPKTLLGCPFCAGEPEFERFGNPRQSTIIACTECGCRLENGEVRGYGDAWNRRVAGAVVPPGPQPDPRDRFIGLLVRCTGLERAEAMKVACASPALRLQLLTYSFFTMRAEIPDIVLERMRPLGDMLQMLAFGEVSDAFLPEVGMPADRFANLCAYSMFLANGGLSGAGGSSLFFTAGGAVDGSLQVLLSVQRLLEPALGEAAQEIAPLFGLSPERAERVLRAEPYFLVESFLDVSPSAALDPSSDFVRSAFGDNRWALMPAIQMFMLLDGNAFYDISDDAIELSYLPEARALIDMVGHDLFFDIQSRHFQRD